MLAPERAEKVLSIKRVNPNRGPDDVHLSHEVTDSSNAASTGLEPRQESLETSSDAANRAQTQTAEYEAGRLYAWGKDRRY
jgi:hypothetical protein